MIVRCKSEVQTSAEHLHASDLTAWLLTLPGSATVDSILGGDGRPRHPNTRLVGLRASWSEVRNDE